jgi:hypothetical protein
MSHPRVFTIEGSKDRLGFEFPVQLPEIADMERSQHDAFRVAQCEHAAGRKFFSEFVGDVRRLKAAPDRTADVA